MANYEDKVKKEEEELEALEKAAKEEADRISKENSEQDETFVEPEEKPTTNEKPEENPEEESWKKRYGDLRRHQQQKEEDHKKELEDLKNQLDSLQKDGPPAALPENIEELEEWKKKFPDVARIMTTLAEQMAESKFKDAKFDLEELKLEKRKSQEEKNIKIIKESHSDFDELKESDDFQSWANDQPKWVQTALFEQKDDPRSVVRAIDLYKMDKGLTTSDKARQAKEAAKNAASAISAKSGANTPNDGAGKKKIRESWVESLSVEDYEKHEPAILEALRTGNFIRDLSAR